MTTAMEIVRTAYADPANNHLRLAINRKENSIGSWDANKNRFVVIVGMDLRSRWVELPYELLVNGHPPIKAEDWIEVQR